jgi:hypothetical protein
MTTLARARMLGVMAVAMSLSMMVVAHAHSTHQSAINLDAQRWAQQYPAGLYRYYEEALAAQAQRSQDDAMARRFRRLGLYRYYQEALAAQAQRSKEDAVARLGRSERAATEQVTTGNSIRQVAARNDSASVWRTSPKTATWVPATASSRQPRWCVPTLGGVIAALVLAGTLTAVTINRARARVRPGHAETIPQ